MLKAMRGKQPHQRLKWRRYQIRSSGTSGIWKNAGMTRWAKAFGKIKKTTTTITRQLTYSNLSANRHYISFTYEPYLVNKPFSAAGISEDNAQGWKIVQKMNSWPRSEASREAVKFWGQSFSREHYPSIYQQAGKGVYLFYNPPNNLSRRTHVDRSCIFCGFFCVSLGRIVNQLFNFSITGFWKKNVLLFSMTD